MQLLRLHLLSASETMQIRCSLEMLMSICLRSIRLLLLVAMLFSATNASAQVCASLTLTTQAEVDAVNCSSVTGDVGIFGSDITDSARCLR